MALEVLIRIVAGDLVETVQDQVADVDADLAADTGTRVSLGDRVGLHVDWARIGTKIGKAAANIGEVAGKLFRGGVAGILLVIGEWMLQGLMEKLATPEGKPLVDALALVGDALLDMGAEILVALSPILVDLVVALAPVVGALGAIVHTLWPVLGPALFLPVTVLQLWVKFQLALLEGMAKIAGWIGSVLADILTPLLEAGQAIAGAIGDIPGWAAGVLSSIVTGILDPIQAGLETVFHLVFPELTNDTHTYWANGRAWPVGTGPFPGASSGWEYVPPRMVTPDDQAILAAVDQWLRANGGTAALDRQVRRAW